jgi:Ca-activated chloride channel family protein
MPALELARKMSKSRDLSVVILSDGADELSYETEAVFAKENSLVVNVMMLATKVGDTLELENGELLKDELGNIVVSRENSAIKEICTKSGGIYSKSFSEVLDAIESQSRNDKKTNATLIRNFELFYLFIFLAIVSFLASTTTLKKYIVLFLLFFGVSLNATTLEEANSYYRSAEYEKAFHSYEMLKSSDIEFKSVVYYNMGNSLIRLKKFTKAREAFVKSLTLSYSKEAYENLIYIQNAEEQMQMNTGQKKSNQKSSIAKKESNSKKKKRGGSSNMKVSANASSGADDGKKSSSKASLDLNSHRAKLSSKQYELINKRGVNEKQPW